jgi:hypothetical protein
MNAEERNEHMPRTEYMSVAVPVDPTTWAAVRRLALSLEIPVGELIRRALYAAYGKQIDRERQCVSVQRGEDKKAS